MVTPGQSNVIQKQFYHCPPRKLRQGNVFSCVCLSTEGGSHLTITHDALDLTAESTPTPSDMNLTLQGPRHETPLYRASIPLDMGPYYIATPRAEIWWLRSEEGRTHSS